MNVLPPPRLSGNAWRRLSTGAYAGAADALERLEADLASDYDVADPAARAAVWEAAGGGAEGPILHEIVLRYEAEAARRTPRLRRAAGTVPNGFRADPALSAPPGAFR